MNESVRVLDQAAFHAWVTLGEILLDFNETRPTYLTRREEIQAAYDELGEALEGYRRSSGPSGPYAAPKGDVEGTGHGWTPPSEQE